MAKKGENIYARKDGRWEGRYMIERLASGKYHYGYVYAGTYREAKELLLKKKMELLQQKQCSEKVSESATNAALSSTPFEKLVREWLDSSRPQVKESSYVKYRNLARCYIIPELGTLRWKELKRETLESFSNKMLSSGGRRQKGLSAKTVSDTLSVIRTVFRYAVSKGYPSPCDFSMLSIKRSTKDFRILSLVEQKKLCTYLQRNLTPVNLGILISLFSGLRIGEICALTWADISLEEKIITIHRTMQRLQNIQGQEKKTRICISTPKSRCSVRQIPIPDILMELLEKYPAEMNGYVLTGKKNTYLEPRAMQRHFKRVLKAASIENVNYHVLRHTFATRCVELDFDVKSLSEILGHASVNITMNRYVHPSMELKRKNMQRLSELIAVS